eukprot:s1568_g7.t1
MEFWWLRLKGGSSFKIFANELQEKDVYSILEVARTKTCLNVPIHKLMLFESEQDYHGGKAAFEPDACSSEIRGTTARDALYVSYPDECPDASSAQVVTSDIVEKLEKLEKIAQGQEEKFEKIAQGQEKMQEKVIDWQFPNQSPLPLKVGNVVEVLHDGGTGWVYGHLVGAPESKGFFPPMEEYLREMERLRATNPGAAHDSKEAFSSRKVTFGELGMKQLPTLEAMLIDVPLFCNLITLSKQEQLPFATGQIF